MEFIPQKSPNDGAKSGSLRSQKSLINDLMHAWDHKHHKVCTFKHTKPSKHPDIQDLASKMVVTHQDKSKRDKEA